MSGNGSGDGHYVELSETKFMELLRCVLVQVEVDEDWYRSYYRDVDEAIKAGNVSSARQHYINAGYFENRLPRKVVVNERWYLEEYPDVAAAIKFGAFSSATAHFERDGFKEGRLPSEGWSLLGEPVRHLQDA
jgi:hypothetical protein